MAGAQRRSDADDPDRDVDLLDHRSGRAADDVDLGYLAPVLRHADVDVRSGVLSARGALEYAPWTKVLTLDAVDLARADLDYVRRRAADAPLGEQASTAAARVTDQPTMQIDVARLEVTGGRFGYRDDTASPPYRQRARGPGRPSMSRGGPRARRT